MPTPKAATLYYSLLAVLGFTRAYGPQGRQIRVTAVLVADLGDVGVYLRF